MPIPHHAPFPFNTPHQHIRADIDDTLGDIVASAFCVPATALHRRSRGPKRVALARQTAIYLAHVRGGLTLAEAGALFGRDRTTAAHACRVVEERRDDPAFDFILTAVENACGIVRDNADGRTTS